MPSITSLAPQLQGLGGTLILMGESFSQTSGRGVSRGSAQNFSRRGEGP